MPFWNRRSPEDQQQLLQQQQEAEASRRSLEAGGLPVQAQRRLTEENHRLFTSDLSTDEFLLTRDAGYEPISQVMGSSIYQVGWQYTYNYTATPAASEQRVISDAHQHATALALGRLEQEAKLLKADGVIGVRLNTRGYEWGNNLLEYTAIGTAIRLPNGPQTDHRPFLSDLSGQEFWTLLQAGYYPVGIVTGFCAYYISLGSVMTQQMRGWYNMGGFNTGGYGSYNQEIVPFSQGIYTSRHIAMSRLTGMAQNLGASGVVGMHISCDREVKDYAQDRGEYAPKLYYMDLAVQFSAIGTAIT
ncbi:MAG: heavy metal-binding domain-containing protein, partial [Chloroflexota bacterium]|nr:heavy metal-binding domain-containing protein [Chloroflexota bacterium]